MLSKFVVALGGNAILRPGQTGTSEEQLANVRVSCEQIVRLLKAGHELLITHGNGPQVGNILRQQDASRNQIPPQKLDVCGAQSQGMIGYFIQQSLHNILRREGITRPVATVLTQVLVDKDDPAFQNPSKPVGGFFSEEEARLRVAQGETWVEDAGRGWRKVVPSPQPLAIMEGATICELVKAGTVVIASGGGGIPVYRDTQGVIGIEAVIDKDLAAAKLVEEISGDGLLILTDVPQVFINYGRENQEGLAQVNVEKAEQYVSEGQFSAGSMLPKVQAAIKVARQGKTAIITSLDKAELALQGKAGTRFLN